MAGGDNPKTLEASKGPLGGPYKPYEIDLGKENKAQIAKADGTKTIIVVKSSVGEFLGLKRAQGYILGTGKKSQVTVRKHGRGTKKVRLWFAKETAISCTNRYGSTVSKSVKSIQFRVPTYVGILSVLKWAEAHGSSKGIVAVESVETGEFYELGTGTASAAK